MKTATHPKYFPDKLEAKWREKWSDAKLYDFTFEKDKKKYYVLVELPYPSGDLHIGHWFTFVTPDVLARFKKMIGETVFFPMGYDAFGLPAENAAIKRDIHPQKWTMSNIESMTKQFQTMGTMIDWRSTTITCLPEYYKWNQWIFLQMYEKGIAYRSKTLSNWCPVDQTVLANEHVESGKCWRCGNEVIQKEVEQWFLKITDYADALLWENTNENVSNGVQWPQSVREGQNNWIGKSEGALIKFQIPSFKAQIEVFTTRPDTLYGATFIVVSPEHEILKQVQDDKVLEYIVAASRKTQLERKENKEKTGVFSTLYATNPVTHKEIPIWVADYVLAGYGTGAIMAVPAHDERDFEFAEKFGLSIQPVIESAENQSLPYVGPGTLINSGAWDGWEVPKNMGKVIEWLAEKGLATSKTQYHLHDWSVSRQRYWGTPVPIINCEKCGTVPVPEKDLPVEIPMDVDYMPKGKPPLASNDAWFHTTCPKCGGKATRDAETLDTFFDSSWYYYRYIDPNYEGGPFDMQKVKELMPLDIYFGGSEHILGHTLYARFFTKFFKDLGLIDFDEFALKRVQHGIVLGTDGNKMSKSKGNVINPDDVVKEYGTDAVRIYLSFMMPYEATGPWSTSAMSGMYRFLKRVWDLQQKVVKVPQVPNVPKGEKTFDTSGIPQGDLPLQGGASDTFDTLSKDDLLQMHKTIKKVRHDIEAIKLNTAIAAIMEWLNYLSAKESVSHEEYETLLLLLAPFAPHMTEELWQSLEIVKVPQVPNVPKEEKAFDTSGIPQGDLPLQGGASDTFGTFKSIHQQSFPEVNEAYLKEDTVTIVVQVNGKVRENLTVDSAILKEQSKVEELGQKAEKVAKHLDGKDIKKIIYIPGKILNFVVV